MDRFTDGNPFTTEVFIDFVFEETVMIVTDDWVRSFLGRHSDDVTYRYCKPRDTARMEVSKESV
jgi:hypothetical protein